jgi:hypothetical protein
MSFKLPSYRILLSKIAIYSIAIAIATLCFVPVANAVTQNLQFNSPKGYTIETFFSYDAANSKAIAEHGRGKANILDSLKVNFYDPAGKAIASYDNIVDGIVRGDYFEFNYDPATQQLKGELDLGGESAGEMYLKGEANGDLSLIWIEESGEEQIIDTVSSDDYN